MPSTSCKSHLKDYCSNCTFAGVHFIADEERHWTERWIWLGLVALSWYGSAILTISAWDAFILSPISFGVETTYIDWETRMPAVGICEEENLERVYNVSDTIWPPDHPADLEDVLRELAYFRGISLYILDQCYKYKVHHLCPVTNISYYAELVRSNCESTLAHCSYNGENFDCCEYFQKIQTDIGRCYILNSIQTEEPKPYPMVLNKTSKHGLISLEVLVPSKIYTLGVDDVPGLTTSYSTALKINLGHRYKRHITISNIENDPLVVETTPKQRACRFHYENEDGVYPHYSYSTCTILCRKRAQIKTCSCNDHLMPGTTQDQHCNMTGIACLVAHHSDLSTLKPRWASRPGLACDCLPSCSETDIRVIKDEATSVKKKKTKSTVQIKLAYLPTERFKRNVVRSRLDLVVSVGGTTGLFVGASLLSFVELIFYFTIRYASNLMMERDRGKKQAVEVEPEVETVVVKYEGPYESSGVLESKLVVDKYLAERISDKGANMKRKQIEYFKKLKTMQ